MNYSKKIVFINNKKFLVHSVLKLSQSYNVLGFWELAPDKWSAHIQSVSLSPLEFKEIFNN